MAEHKLKPRGRPFPKGVSGNPLGRKRGHRTHLSLISEATAEGLKRMVDDGTITAGEALALRRIQIGLTAKPGIALAAIDSIENRVEGRPTQSVQITQKLDESTARRLADLAYLLMPEALKPELEGQKPRLGPCIDGEANFCAAKNTELDEASGCEPEGNDE